MSKPLPLESVHFELYLPDLSPEALDSPDEFLKTFEFY